MFKYIKYSIERFHITHEKGNEWKSSVGLDVVGCMSVDRIYFYILFYMNRFFTIHIIELLGFLTLIKFMNIKTKKYV